jgi:hypothetical protein
MRCPRFVGRHSGAGISKYCEVTRGQTCGQRIRDLGEWPMATYQMVYGDDDQVRTEVLDNIDEVEREDGWVVLFRGPEAIMRVQESHVRSLERLDP